MNGQDIKAVLADIVYEKGSDEEIVITGPKAFKSLQIRKEALVLSNYIDNVEIDSIMTTTGNQQVTLNQLYGNIYFSNLKMSGLFDGINATELEMNSIRTFGDQFVQTPLAVSNHLSSSSIDVKESANDVLVSDFYFIDDQIHFNSNMKIGMLDLSVNNIKVINDIVGTGLLTSLDLKDFEKNHLSRSLEQNIIYPVKVNKLIVGDMFNAKIINGMLFETFRDYLMNLKDFKKNLLSGKHKLDNLIIDGNVNLRYINDKDFEFIKNHVIWLNRPNNVEAALHFLDSTDVYEGLTVQSFMNRKNFSDFLDNWISKTQDPIIINSDKIAGTSVMVEENMDVDKINNIPYDNIFRKEDLIETRYLKIAGTVNVNKLYVKDKFNQKSAQDLENVYLYEKGSMTHTINSDVKFVQNSNIRNLNTPFLNKLNVSYWLSDLIRYNDQNIYVKGAKSFRSPVMAEKGCYIDTFNELNVKNMMQNIVIMKKNEIVNIHSNIQLLDDFYAELVGLKGNLTTDFIDGINLHEWIHNALPIHLDVEYENTLITESRFIQASNLKVKAINGVPFNNFFTLHTNQTFDYNIVVEGAVNVTNPMIVNGLVNQINLRTERDNTVMLSDKSQEIYTDIFLEDALVLNSVTANGLVNSKNIANIAVLNSSPNFDSSLTFINLEASNLVSDDRISSINFTKWYENALWKKGKEVQHIYGNWRLQTIYLENNVFGNGLINGQPINEIEKNLNKNVHEIEMALTNYSVEYRSMCEKLQYRADDISKSSIYVLKYFEEAFKIIEYGNIFSYFTFTTKKNRNYLLVNTNCTTNIYKWKRSQEQFVKLSTVETGVIYSWNKLEPENSHDVFIITNSKMSANAPCLYGGTNSWKMVKDNLIHISSISYDTNVLELFVHPLNSYSFYALDNLDHVTNYNITGQIVEKWKLPVENSTYSFLSADILGGLNLNNGRKIYSLDSTSIRRRQRSVYSDAQIMTVSRAKAHSNDSPTYTLKKPDFHLYPNSNYTVPLIPSKPVKTTKRIDFMSKVKDAGDVIRRSFNLQTAYLSPSSNASKIAKVNGSDDKLLFAFKSPNVTALREKMVINAAKTTLVRNDKVENEKFMVEKLKELEDAIKNDIKDSDNLQAVTDSPKMEENQTEPIYSFSPRIIMNDENNEQGASTTERIGLENVFNFEPIVEAVMINGEGVRDTENNIIPEHGQGEIAVLNVGTKKNRKTLYAVSRKRTSVIQGNNVIEIYSDIINEKVFQYIVCTDPSNIHPLHFRDETLLAFMESRREVKIYIYRGIQGFTLFKSISLPDYAYQMSSVTLPPKIQYKCDYRYLVFHFERELLFMSIKVDGNCGLRHIECDVMLQVLEVCV
ncbi:unnamed protein product [Chironomus riparius]|uniref:Uncharacterized protein n=1 Tax=Chironomus riparius TaxID=315576 RepID=A0A9N9WP97_9DIPT|nr:unnamed protein product [Chironomus riparius]